MKKISYNDGQGSRDRKVMLVLFIPSINKLVKFNSEDIDGLCIITNEDYTKNGKWSNSTYELAIPNEVLHCEIRQDWENGYYIPEGNWEDAFNNFVLKTEFKTLSFEEFVSFVTVQYPITSERLNETQKKLSRLDNSDYSFLTIQNEYDNVVNELKNAIQDAEIKLEMERLQVKTEKLKTKLKEKGKMSLEELSELYKKL